MANIELGHGSGGRLTKDLIERIFLKHLSSRQLSFLEDAAVIEIDGRNMSVSTDSYVVRPLFFPGGDIGRLSVCGTMNDLVVSGAIPRYITVGLIIEEGLALSDLENIIRSMGETATASNVGVVAGDTKVVERERGDGIYINTTGIGDVVREMKPEHISPGDAIIVTGTAGDHGISIAVARNEFSIDAPVQSDCACLLHLLQPLFDMKGVKWMRDPTRGGVATVLAECAEMSGLGVRISEESVPVREDVRFIADMLGYDPLYLANEGKAVIVVSSDSTNEALDRLRSHPLGREAAVIGKVTDRFKGVRLKTRIGGERLLDLLEEELLPRIC